MLGVAVILTGGGTSERLDVIGLALGAGVAYAGVLIWLRILPRFIPTLAHGSESPRQRWVLLPATAQFSLPTLGQLAWLFLFGAIQMGLPYWLMTRGLQTINPAEASMLSLLEPILNPLWAYLVSPAERNLRPGDLDRRGADSVGDRVSVLAGAARKRKSVVYSFVNRMYSYSRQHLPQAADVHRPRKLDVAGLPIRPGSAAACQPWPVRKDLYRRR